MGAYRCSEAFAVWRPNQIIDIVRQLSDQNWFDKIPVMGALLARPNPDAPFLRDRSS